MKTKNELEKCAERLLGSKKPKIIAANFYENDIPLSDEKLKHFKTAEYLWNLTPQTIEGPYKNQHMGLLLDEKLDYVHIVFASKEFLNYLSKI